MSWKKSEEQLAHLDDDDGFLNDVAHSSRDEVQQDVDATFGSSFNLDRTLSNRPNRLSHEIDIHL